MKKLEIRNFEPCTEDTSTDQRPTPPLSHQMGHVAWRSYAAGDIRIEWFGRYFGGWRIIRLNGYRRIQNWRRWYGFG